MNAYIRYILFGVGVWAGPFVLGMLLFAVVDPASALFDTLMSVAMSASAAWMAWLYLRARGGDGFVLGLGWAAICIVLDIPWFLIPQALGGPMSVADYFADIGLTYLMVPIIAGFIGLSLRR